MIATTRRIDPRTDEPCALNIRDIPANQKNRFKVWCAERGYTIKEAILHLMDIAVKNDIEVPRDE